MQLRLMKRHLYQKKLTHCARLAELHPTLAAAHYELSVEFKNRFKDVRDCEDFKLFFAPFGVDSVDVAGNLQLGLLELRKVCNFLAHPVFMLVLCDSRCFPAHVRETLTSSLFCSTYSCVQLFTSMELTKNRTVLADTHLHNVLPRLIRPSSRTLTP